MNDHIHDCERFESLLPDLLEDELDRATAAEALLAARGCRQCTTLLDELIAIRDQAAALAGLRPERDLWPEIAERIDAPVVSIGDRIPERREARPELVRRFLHPAWLAAAAVLLVVVTATVTWLAVGRDAPGVQLAANDAGAAALTTPGSFVVASVEAPYRNEIDMLRALVDEQRAEYDSATVAVIERNLTIIEAAIVESRAALARDTTSRFLREQLNGALERKVELLRTAAMLPPSRT